MATCTIIDNRAEYTEQQFRDGLKKTKDFNAAINARGLLDTEQIMFADGEAAPDSVEKLATTSRSNIVNTLRKAYDRGATALEGADNMRIDIGKKLAALRKEWAKQIGQSKIDAYNAKISNTPISVYQSLAEKIFQPSDVLAAAIGITEAEYEDFLTGEAVSEDVRDAIYAYEEATLTKAEASLYKAMRAILHSEFPLMQRANKIIFDKSATAANPNVIAENAENNINVAKSRWTKFFKDDTAIGGFIHKYTKKWAAVLPIYNLLQKMGIHKGTSSYEVLYEAINKAKDYLENDNAVTSALMGGLLKNKSIAKLTNFLVGTSWQNVEKVDLDVGGETKQLSVGEALAAYMTLRQDRVREDFIAKEDEEPKLIYFNQYGQRKKFSMALTEDIWNQIKAIGEDAKYQNIISLFDEILDGQHTKMADTMFLINGQKLPQIEKYFPLYSNYENLTPRQRSERLVEDLRYTKERLGGIESLSISDVFSTMDRYVKASNYFSYMSVPVHNASVLMGQLANSKKNAFEGGFEEIHKRYMSWLDGVESDKARVDYLEADKFFNKMYRKYYIGVLGWNIPVALKQPTAAMHALNFFGSPKYAKYVFTAYGAALDPKSTLIKRWVEHSITAKPYTTALAAAELAERIEIGAHSSLNKVMMTGNLGKVEYAARRVGDTYINTALELTRRFDVAGRAALFAATEEYVKDNYNLREGDSGYWELVENIHAQAMKETQQTWDLMHRSSIARHPNVLVKGLLMFTTQLQKHLALFDTAFNNAIMYGRKEDYTHLMYTGLSIAILQAGMIAALDMGKDALLGFDDDDEEEKWRTLAAKTLSNNIATLPLGGMFSNNIANGVFDTKEYTRPVSMPVIDLFNQMQRSVDNIGSDKELSEKSQALYNQIWKEYFKFAGIPLAPFKQYQQYLDNQK